MGEWRKHRSLWDKEAETTRFSGTGENNHGTGENNHWTGKEHNSSHDSGRYREFSASVSYRAPNFRDKSGQSSLVSIKENPVAPERKEIGGENKYYQKMSSEFNYSHSLGNDRSHSRRNSGRGRSRSRSPSRGSERERARGKNRSRSRSRGDGTGEIRRNRADHGHLSRHSYSNRGSRSESRDVVSDPYQGEDEQFQNRNRGAVPCENFIKGKCRWGDTCRFTHHFASDGTFGKGTGYSSSDKDNEQQPYKNGKPLCKYFVAGKCDLNNCRFSHEDSRFDNPEGTEGKVNDDDSFHNNGNKNVIQGIQERAGNLIDWNDRTYSGELGTGESIVEENMADKQAVLLLHDSQLRNQDGNFNVQGANESVVVQQFSMETWQNVSHIHGLIENKSVSSLRSDVLDEVNEARNAAYSIPLSGQNLSQSGENVFPGHSSIPIETESGPYPSPSNLVANINLQPQMQNHQNATQTTATLETRVPQFFSDLASSDHSSQFTNPLIPLVETNNIQSNPFSLSHEPIHPMEDDSNANAVVGPDDVKPDDSGRSRLEQQTVLANSQVDEGKGAISEKSNKDSETVDGHGKAEESNNANKDEKGMRLFKNSLIEFVKDILKPTWKEGRMSREVHKTIVKKVVDKITSTIQADHIPKTQEKVDQYLSFSKPKIAKLVQAYVGRCLKTDS